MAEDSSEEKSEEPTPHRLREAREKGQIAKSREVTTALLLFISYIAFRYLGEAMWTQLLNMSRSILGLISEGKSFSMATAGYVMLIAAQGFGFAVAPIFLVVFIASLLSEALQTGFVFAADPLSPKLERISPIEGFKRLFSIQGLVETIKSILKIVIVFYIAWTVIRDDLPNLILLINAHPWDGVILGGNIAYTIAIRVAVFYIVIAVLDYLYRRWEYMRKLRMSRKEIKEEYKRLEGDPLVKQRMRDLQREVAQQRMMQAVPKSDVVVTNPTHVAVALKYEKEKMDAPKLLAKGQRKAAAEIIKIAREYEIPIVPNEPLARSIFRTTKVNRLIPRELYKPTAEVLAYVYKIKEDRKARRRASVLAGLKPS